jgi:hypothetical protein
MSRLVHLEVFCRIDQHLPHALADFLRLAINKRPHAPDDQLEHARAGLHVGKAPGQLNADGHERILPHGCFEFLLRVLHLERDPSRDPVLFAHELDHPRLSRGRSSDEPPESAETHQPVKPRSNRQRQRQKQDERGDEEYDGRRGEAEEAGPAESVTELALRAFCSVR